MQNVVPPQPSKPDPMRFFGTEVSDQVRNSVRELERRLQDARREVVKMWAAIALFDKCCEDEATAAPLSVGHYDPATFYKIRQNRDLFFNWKMFAVRGVLDSLYQFDFVRTGIKGIAEQPLVAPLLVDSKGAKKDGQKIDKLIPDATAIRHAAQHVAEIEKKFVENAYVGGKDEGPIVFPEGVPVLLQDNLIERTYQVTRKKKVLSLDITWETYLKFLEVYEGLLEATYLKNHGGMPAGSHPNANDL